MTPPPDRLHVHIRFKGGATDSLALPLPETAWRQRLTHPDVVALIDRLLEQYDDDHQVAEHLNAQAVVTRANNPFDAAAVRWVRHVHGLESHQERLRARGKLTTQEMAARLGLDVRTVRQMARDGRLIGAQCGSKATWLADPIEEQPDAVRRLAQRQADLQSQGSLPPRSPTTPQALQARIEPLVLAGHDDAAIAEILNAEGWHTVNGGSFCATTVRGNRERQPAPPVPASRSRNRDESSYPRSWRTPKPDPCAGYDSRRTPKPDPCAGYGSRWTPKPDPCAGYGPRRTPKPDPCAGYGSRRTPKPDPWAGYGSRTTPKPYPSSGIASQEPHRLPPHRISPRTATRRTVVHPPLRRAPPGPRSAANSALERSSSLPPTAVSPPIGGWLQSISLGSWGPSPCCSKISMLHLTRRLAPANHPERRDAVVNEATQCNGTGQLTPRSTAETCFACRVFAGETNPERHTMARSFELSPWRSYSGDTNESVTLSRQDWLDGGDYADGVFWVDIKSVSNATLTIETAPADEDSYFQSLFASGLTATGTTLLVSRFATATTPIMRFIRWKATGASAWSITFRICGVLKNA